MSKGRKHPYANGLELEIPVTKKFALLNIDNRSLHTEIFVVMCIYMEHTFHCFAHLRA